MPSIYLSLILMVLAGPIYALLRALSLVLPLYMVLLVVGIVNLIFLLKGSQCSPIDEVFSLVALVIGTICMILGFAFAPLPVQLAGAIAALFVINRTRLIEG
jgi:hypothetical protein